MGVVSFSTGNEWPPALRVSFRRLNIVLCRPSEHITDQMLCVILDKYTAIEDVGCQSFIRDETSQSFQTAIELWKVTAVAVLALGDMHISTSITFALVVGEYQL